MLTANVRNLTCMETVGERLRRSREAAGLSQEQLGSYIGATRSAVAQVELGISNSLNAENLAKAAHRLGKNAVWLATGEGEETSLEPLGEALNALPERDREEIFKFIRYKITTVMVPYATNEKAASYAAMVDNLVADMQHRQATKAK